MESEEYMMGAVFWHVTAYGLEKIYRRCGGTSHLNLTCKRAVFEPEDEDNVRKFLP
jgi:hypothetical protein